MYRLLIESLLGVSRRGNALHFASCVPAAWTSYRIDYRNGDSTYRIEVLPGTDGASELAIDGAAGDTAALLLQDSGDRDVVVKVPASLGKGLVLVAAAED